MVSSSAGSNRGCQRGAIWGQLRFYHAALCPTFAGHEPLRVHSQRDSAMRYQASCLSRDHRRITRRQPGAAASDRGSFRLEHGGQRQFGIGSHARPLGVHQLPRILKFPPTLHADLVRAPLNGEYAAALLVMAPKHRLEYPH